MHCKNAHRAVCSKEVSEAAVPMCVYSPPSFYFSNFLFSLMCSREIRCAVDSLHPLAEIFKTEIWRDKMSSTFKSITDSFCPEGGSVIINGVERYVVQVWCRTGWSSSILASFLIFLPTSLATLPQLLSTMFPLCFFLTCILKSGLA